MAVGSKSMERAAKAAEGKKTETKTETKKAPAKRAAKAVKTPAAEPETAVIAKPEAAVMERIVYQKSAQILERAAEPNERFGLGDAMPIYYL